MPMVLLSWDAMTPVQLLALVLVEDKTIAKVPAEWPG